MIQFQQTPQFNKNAALLLVYSDKNHSKLIPANKSTLRQKISSLFKDKEFNAKAGELYPVSEGKTTVVLLGLGQKKSLSSVKLRTFVRKALLSSYLKDKKQIEIVPAFDDEKNIIALVEGIMLGTYSWDKYKTGSVKNKPKKSYFLTSSKSKSAADAVKICQGVNFARDLVNENADVTTSAFLERKIKALVRGKKNVKVEILDRKKLKSKGLGLHLAVNQGSANEPKLVIVRYNGGGKQPYTALIGKGLTFDTGGLNLKPTGGIENMKLDMSGAAAVIGTLKCILDLKPKKNVIFACGLAENVTDAKAYKPGDVIKGYLGKTVEVLNTDAEGRLVLADAISYVNRNYQPKRIIDIATLTGACIVGLGYEHTGLMSDNDKFAEQLLRSAKKTDDWAWRLPLYPDLKDALKSKIADIKNIGWPKGAAGTLTAGEFLHQFTEKTDWAHLDIAGTSFVDGDSRQYFGYGATGAGIRLLTDFLLNN